MAKAPFYVVDRYDALGMARPDPATICRGQCEGTGVVPVSLPESDTALAELWHQAEANEPASDGWHFVVCPTCDGTGKDGKGLNG